MAVCVSDAEAGNRMMKQLYRALLVVGLLLASVQVRAEFRYEIIASGLDHPWAIAFLPSGDLLVTERAGRLRLVKNGQLQTAPITGVPTVYTRGQAGLFDLALDPDFTHNRYLYLSYAHGTGKENATRVARARLEGNRLVDLEVIFTAQPAKDTPHHYGGRMAFRADKTLLLTIGDGFDYREQAQSLDSLLGKTVRLNRDGSIPKDNPFVGNARARSEIWSYGHRNPQGIVLDPDSGRVYIHEHGPRGGDELNLLQPGLNYGWPAITYGVDYNLATISPYSEYPGMEQPLIYWVPSIAPAGMDYYRGHMFPEWQGDLLIAALAEKSVRRIMLENGRITGQQVLFQELGARIRDVRVAADGAIYLLTDSAQGQVLRVTQGIAR